MGYEGRFPLLCSIFVCTFFCFAALPCCSCATITRGNSKSCKLNCIIPFTLDLQCASNGVTYLNTEEFQCAKTQCFPDLRRVHRGKCPTAWNSLKTGEPEQSQEGNGKKILRSCECNCDFPSVKDQVCGTDGRTYPSECHLNCQRSCSNLLALEKHYDGVCGRLFFPVDPEYVDEINMPS